MKSGRATLSGRRAGSRRRTETTSAPASRAFNHSVAAAIPAPTIPTRDAYSCGSYACTARGSPSSSVGRASPGCPGASSTWRKTPCPSSSKPPSTARTRSTRACRKLSSQRLLARSSSTCARNSSTVGRYRSQTLRMRGARSRRRAASRTASPGKEVGQQCPSLSDRISRWRIAAARGRQAPAGPGRRRRRRSRPAPGRRASASRRRRTRRARSRRSQPAVSRGLLHRAGEQALDEVALEREEDGQRDRQRDERGRGDQLDVGAELAQLREDRDRDRLRRRGRT